MLILRIVMLHKGVEPSRQVDPELRRIIVFQGRIVRAKLMVLVIRKAGDFLYKVVLGVSSIGQILWNARVMMCLYLGSLHGLAGAYEPHYRLYGEAGGHLGDSYSRHVRPRRHVLCSTSFSWYIRRAA